jgi:hypothetical protein
VALRSIEAEEVRAIAGLSKAAREAQDVLLNKMKIVDKFDDERELSSAVAGTLDTLDASLNNPPLRELKERVAALSPEARQELMALMWIGRGDYAAAEWEAALDEAQRRANAGDVDDIAERAPLHDYLLKGLYLLDQA